MDDDPRLEEARYDNASAAWPKIREQNSVVEVYIHQLALHDCGTSTYIVVEEA